MAERATAKRAIRNPLLALIATWVLFMLGSYIDMAAPDTTWDSKGEPTYPDPSIQWQIYVFLLGITVFALIALRSLHVAVGLRSNLDRPLAKSAHRFTNLAVILSLVAGAVFAVGNFLGAWNSYDQQNEPVWMRLVNVYLPIVLATALVVYTLLSAFVFRKDAPDIPEGEKDEARAKLQRAVGLAYAVPVIGTAIAIIFGLTVYDITKTSLDAWIWVIIQAIIGFSIILGTTFAARARSARPLPPRERKSGVAAVNLNFVLSVVFGVVVLFMAFTLGFSGVDGLREYVDRMEIVDGREVYNYEWTLSAPSIGWLIEDMLPPMLLLLLAEWGIYRTLVIRNEEAKQN
jgi:cytochrome bd-type quinol oxidase subunit 2